MWCTRRRAPLKTHHEEFIQRIAKLAIARLPVAEREKVKARIVYGVGAGTGARGVTYFGRWQNGEPQPIPIVEICAAGEESAVQVAGTTIHEIAHVLAGLEAGHGNAWRAACERLGLRRAKAAGMDYQGCAFAPEIRFEIAKADLADGRPVFSLGTASRGPRPCSAGVGTRGGKSRGSGSGSRMRKWVCECGVIVRVARDDFAAHCDLCGSAFTRG